MIRYIAMYVDDKTSELQKSNKWIKLLMMVVHCCAPLSRARPSRQLAERGGGGEGVPGTRDRAGHGGLHTAQERTLRPLVPCHRARRTATGLWCLEKCVRFVTENAFIM